MALSEAIVPSGSSSRPVTGLQKIQFWTFTFSDPTHCEESACLARYREVEARKGHFLTKKTGGGRRDGLPPAFAPRMPVVFEDD